MPALLRAVAKIDEDAQRSGEPEFAVLVVRQSDQLSGQGWWDDWNRRCEYDGRSSGPDAARFVHMKQQLALDH